MKVLYKGLENPSFNVLNDEIIVTENKVDTPVGQQKTLVMKLEDIQVLDLTVETDPQPEFIQLNLNITE